MLYDTERKGSSGRSRCGDDSKEQPGDGTGRRWTRVTKMRRAKLGNRDLVSEVNGLYLGK